MQIRYLRSGLLLAMLIASLHVAAATRVWTLTGVQFDDGAIATGYFSYDDATQKITNWNVRVSQGSLLGFTYVPGNSGAGVGPYGISFDSWVGEGVERVLTLSLVAPLYDGNSAVSISYSEEVYYWGAWDLGFRGLIAGSLALTALPPSVSLVRVDEFYHPLLRHYFITAEAAEKQDLDTGVHPGWVRTGESFKAYATGTSASGSINPVCRYYGNPLRGLDSHFYSADAAECQTLHWENASDWLFESDNVFQINLPDKATGACPDGTIPVYRLWNQRTDSNHRYTTSTAIKAEMLAAGYIAEGYGQDGVVMCAVQ